MCTTNCHSKLTNVKWIMENETASTKPTTNNGKQIKSDKGTRLLFAMHTYGSHVPVIQN